jgi:hypothetical protein
LVGSISFTVCQFSNWQEGLGAPPTRDRPSFASASATAKGTPEYSTVDSVPPPRARRMLNRALHHVLFQILKLPMVS